MKYKGKNDNGLKSNLQLPKTTELVSINCRIKGSLFRYLEVKFKYSKDKGSSIPHQSYDLNGSIEVEKSKTHLNQEIEENECLSISNNENLQG